MINNGTPSQEVEMNLQLFAEGETFADTAETQTGADTATETYTTGAEQQTVFERPSFRVKYNHQEMELPYEEAVQHIQKGMNYEKAVERARQEALDEYISSQGYEWNGKPIKTKAEYDQALKEKEIFERYQAQGLPDEVVNELVEMKRFREETLAEKRVREEQETQARQQQEYEELKNSMYMEFVNEFKDFDTEDKIKTIPPEVFAEAEKWLQTSGREGRRLSDAFARHNYNKMMSQQQATQANTANAASSTGSVKGNGLPDSGFIPQEVFEQNRGNQNWLLANYDKLNKSRLKWSK